MPCQCAHLQCSRNSRERQSKHFEPLCRQSARIVERKICILKHWRRGNFSNRTPRLRLLQTCKSWRPASKAQNVFKFKFRNIFLAATKKNNNTTTKCKPEVAGTLSTVRPDCLDMEKMNRIRIKKSMSFWWIESLQLLFELDMQSAICSREHCVWIRFHYLSFLYSIAFRWLTICVRVHTANADY